MRGIESMLDASPPGIRFGYGELAQGVYEVEEPTRAQLSAIGRAVGRLVEQGKVKRETVVDFTGDEWVKPTPIRPGKYYWRSPAYRGLVIVRETHVWRVLHEDGGLGSSS
jgi:hypothetical protein